jgi:hypothetical protein
MWFYSIRGTQNRSVKKSDAIYETSQKAMIAGTAQIKNNKAAIQRADDVYEIFTVTVGRLTS